MGRRTVRQLPTETTENAWFYECEMRRRGLFIIEICP